MSDCCSTEKANTYEPSKDVLCPKCNEKGKSINIITLKSLLIPNAMKRLDVSLNYQFCRTVTCSIVYFNGTIFFSKDDLTVEVFQKGNKGTTPICYCFGYNRKQLSNDVIENGRSIISEEIKKYVKDKKCACEIRNPQGSCCLGSISKVIKDVLTN